MKQIKSWFIRSAALLVLFLNLIALVVTTSCILTLFVMLYLLDLLFTLLCDLSTGIADDLPMLAKAARDGNTTETNTKNVNS